MFSEDAESRVIELWADFQRTKSVVGGRAFAISITDSNAANLCFRLLSDRGMAAQLDMFLDHQEDVRNRSKQAHKKSYENVPMLCVRVLHTVAMPSLFLHSELLFCCPLPWK